VGRRRANGKEGKGGDEGRKSNASVALLIGESRLRTSPGCSPLGCHLPSAACRQHPAARAGQNRALAGRVAQTGREGRV
jgi:hypothetical protein